MNLRSLMPVGRDRECSPAAIVRSISLQREIDRLFDDFSARVSHDLQRRR